MGVEDKIMEDPQIPTEASDKLGVNRNMSLTTWITNNYAIVIGSVIGVFVIRWIYKDLRKRWFAYFMHMISKDAHLNPKAVELKNDVFEKLSSVISHDPALRKIGALKILEIGVGTGTNFPFFPNGTHLTVVDPNPYFKSYYAENRKKFPNIHAENIIEATGEDMNMIPDNSMDVVVVTLVLCTVKNIKKVLKEIQRVLVPGGKFFFCEHVQEFDTVNHKTRRLMQTILTVTGIWPFFFDDCHLNRDLLREIEDAGFSKVEATKFHCPGDNFVFQVIKPSLRGLAVK